MYTCAEQLPIEIWLTIFRYLEAHDLFQAFQNLNHHFDQILASDHLSFYFQLKKTDYHYQSNAVTSYWSDSILNRIISLEPVAHNQSGYFLQFLGRYVNKLSRLQRMTVKIHLQEIPHICTVLQEFKFLEYLSLTCVPNQALFETILSIFSLRRCRLILWDSMATMNYNSDMNSNIENLTLTFLKQSNLSIINLCLTHMPKLKKLEISSHDSHNDKISFFPEQLFILPELRILKMKFEYGVFLSDCFNYLLTAMPVLQRFQLNCSHYELTDVFMEHFIDHWWSIIEQIDRINIFIEGYTGINTSNDNTQTNLEKYRQILSDKTNQINNSFQIKWIEKPVLSFKLIRITIVKS